MARERLATYNVVGTFADMEGARRAMSALERGGIEGDDISLLGRTAAAAAADPDPKQRDAGMATDVSKAGAAGAAAGGAGGALAGFIAGAAAFGIPGIGPVVGSGIWAATLGGAGVGAAIGGLVGGTAATSQSEAWETTYQDSVRAGRVLVGVHSDNEGEIERAADILRGAAPLQLDRLDSEGRQRAVG